MKRILFITAFPPNRMTAGQNYSKVLLSTFAQNHEVDLISFSYPAHVIEVDPKVKLIREYKTSAVSKILSWMKIPFVHPFFAFRFRIGLLIYLLENVKKYDCIYFDFSQVFVYSLFVKHPFKMMMSHDVIFQKMRRGKWFRINPINLLLFISEKKILKTAHTILTFSKKDKLLVQNLYGLDSNVVRFFIDDRIKDLVYTEVNFERKFCFFGAWNRPENLEGLIWFVEKVLPFIDKSIQFEIIGPGLSSGFVEVYAIQDRVKYLGFVDNPYKKLAESLALIAPLFQGAGVKVKVIESLATGTSVLGTAVAFEGIDDLGDGSMVLCNSVNDYIESIHSFPIEVGARKSQTKFLFNSSYSSGDLYDWANF